MKKIIGIIILLAMPMAVGAADLANKPLEFGISGGVLFPGEIEGAWHDDFRVAESRKVSTLPLFLLRAFGDYFFIPNLGMTAGMNFAQLTLDKEVNFGIYDGREHIMPQDGIAMTEFNLGIKGRFFLSERAVVKPGLCTGYRQTFSSSPDARIQGLVLNGNVEFQYYLYENYNIFWDLGFISQPYGGVQDVAYIRANPIMYFNMGFGF